MPRHEPLDQWADRVATHFPNLPRPTAFVLALGAFGMVLAHACALTAVAVHPAGRRCWTSARPSSRCCGRR